MKKNVVISLLIMACAACTSDNEEIIEPMGEAEPLTLTILPEKVGTDNRFALELFQKTCKFAEANDNVFISPLSVSMALNMTLNGAEGQTADEMLTALQAEGYDIDDVNAYSRALKDALMKVDPSTEFSIANSIWYRNKGFTVKTPFLDVNKQNYDAEISALDFSSPDAVTTINNWCAKQTNDKIKEIITNIPDDMAMYLINAVYFKGIWTSKFDKDDTQKEDFRLADGKTDKVNMMRQTGTFNYTADETAAYLEMPYGNQAFGMTVILPNEGSTVADAIAALTDEHWSDITRSLTGCEANIRFPRFKAECEYKLHNDILPDMGMITPFTDYADFSKISDTPLSISEVIHKTFVEVNEKGTEAAAVTEVGMSFTSANPTPPQPVDFTVNKPFLFLIRERSTGIILFIGRMNTIKE